MAKINEKLPDAFGVPQAQRKSLDALRKADPERADQELQKMIDFSIQMVLANAKNMDPFDEEGGNKSGSEMLQTANVIAQLNSAKIQINELRAMADAVKNPGYNALELQGKEIGYDDSMRSFDGKTAVRFDYSLNYPDDKNASLSTTINVKDNNGLTVFSTKGANAMGDHSFDWNGRDSKGNLLPAGSYKIEVNSKASKTVNGKQISFDVHATSELNAIVQSVEVQNGIVTKLVLSNGKVINKDQVISIRDVSEDKSTVKLSPELIGKKVEIDLSRAQVIDGNLDVYYINHIKNPGKATVQVFDEKNKLVKTLESDDIKKVSVDSITFAKTGLTNGNYTVKVTVEDKDDNNIPKKLETAKNVVAVGINYIDKTFITLDDEQFPAHNINTVLLNYTKPIDQRAADYPGKEVTYNDSEIYFQAEMFKPRALATAPEDGEVIAYEELRLYNDQHQMVAILKAEYNPYDQLDEESKERVQLQFVGEYGNLDNDNKTIINRLIEEKLQDGTYKFTGEARTYFDQGLRLLQFPVWDGKFGNVAPQELHGQTARNGQMFTYEHSTIYQRADDTTYFSDSKYDQSKAIVESVDQKNGELYLNLNNGKTIREDQVLVREG